MKPFSFGTYIVDDANREALAICQDMANLRTVEPQPTLILADRGCGKTHLLYSIVNRIFIVNQTRSGSARTAIAYVRARDFPEQVRALIEDPSPIERAQAAIFLVDQLEGFEDHSNELEAVTRIFLDNHHFVLFASSVHPERLGNLTEGLKSILRQGRIVEIHPRSPGTQVKYVEQRARQESEDVIAQLRGELEDLQGRHQKILSELERKAPQDGGAADLVRQLDEARAESAKAREDANAMLAQAQRLLNKVHEEPSQSGQGEGEHGEKTQEAVELETMAAWEDSGPAFAEEPFVEEPSPHAEEEAAEEEAVRIRFDNELRGLREGFEGTQRRLESEIASQQVRIKAITEDRDETHRAIDALRADLDRKKNNQVELEDMMSAASEEIERLRSAASKTPPGPTPAETAEAEALRVRLAEEAEGARAESHDLREALDQSQSEYHAVTAQFKREQEQQRAKSEEVEALRREALDKGAAANAGDVQLRNARDELQRLQEALATARSDYDTLSAQSRRASQETAADAAETAANAAALAKKTSELAAKSTELEALRAEAAKQEASAKARAVEFQSRITTFTAELNLLNRTAARALEERDDLRERLRHTDENRAESTAQAETVRAESKRSREALEQARTELQQVAKQLRQAQEELDALRRDAVGQVAAAYTQAGEFEHKLSAFSAEIERLRDTAPDVQLEREHLREELRLADQARSSLAAQFDDARAQSEQLRKALERAQTEHKALSDELTQTQEELNSRDQEVGDLRRQASEQLTSSKGRADALGEKLAQVSSELELTRQTNRAVASEWQSLQLRLSEDASAAGTLASQFSMARGGGEEESLVQASEPGEIARNGQGAAAGKTSWDEETGQMPPAASPSAADLMGSIASAESVAQADEAPGSEDVLEPLEPLHRPDFGPEFGQEIQFSSGDSSSLHHVEELQDDLGVHRPDSDPFRDLAEEES